MSKIIYGCECIDKCNVHGKWGYTAKNAPVIRTVVKDGKDVNLCSRCTNDDYPMVKNHIKEDIDLMPFFKYDPCLAGAPECRDNDKVRKLTTDNADFVEKAMNKDIEQMKSIGWKGNL